LIYYFNIVGRYKKEDGIQETGVGDKIHRGNKKLN